MLTRIFLAVLLILSVAHAAEEPLDKGLENDADNRMWARMISSLGVQADEDQSHATMFAPTDRAIDAFLYEMGLTFDELLSRPVLVDQIISYHLIPGISIEDFYLKGDGNKDIISSNPDQPSTLVTGDVNALLQAYKSPVTGLVTLIDAQGFRTVVVGQGNAYGNIVFYDVASVLMSASYFYNAKSAFQFYPQWNAAADLFAKAAIYSDAVASSYIGKAESTFLLPNNEALKGAARALVAAPAGELSQVIEYHVIPDLKAVPSDWANDGTVSTLLSGHTITSKLGKITTTDVYTGESVEAPQLVLVSDSGNKARATIFNIYAGKSMIIALDAPLLPNIPAVAKLTGASGGRKLLQRSRGTQRSHSNNWSAQNTQRAIRAAASGNIPVSYATRAGVRNAQFAGSCPNCLMWGL